jgi:hypothetical protein
MLPPLMLQPLLVMGSTQRHLVTMTLSYPNDYDVDHDSTAVNTVNLPSFTCTYLALKEIGCQVGVHKPCIWTKTPCQ